MGVRQYICIPHRPEKHCPYPEDFPQEHRVQQEELRKLELTCGKSSITGLLELLHYLGGFAHLQRETFETMTRDVNRFKQKLVEGSVSEPVDFVPWLKAFRDMCRLVAAPPWQLREAHNVSSGPLRDRFGVNRILEKLERHRECSNVIYLDAC